MAQTKAITKLSDLRLSVEEREQVAELAGELIAVQVYRQLQVAQAAARESSSGCNIIANCCSSSKNDLLQQ